MIQITRSTKSFTVTSHGFFRNLLMNRFYFCNAFLGIICRVTSLITVLKLLLVSAPVKAAAFSKACNAPSSNSLRARAYLAWPVVMFCPADARSMFLAHPSHSSEFPLLKIGMVSSYVVLVGSFGTVRHLTLTHSPLL